MIRTLWLGDVGENPRNGNADVHVTLEDGRGYSFTAFTPSNLALQMEQEGAGHFVCPDLLVVRELTEANVRAAVEEILADHDIARFGIATQE